MFFLLLNTLVFACVLAFAEDYLPSKVRASWIANFILGVTCWALGYLSLSIYPESWLSASIDHDDEYYEAPRCYGGNICE